MMRTIAKFDLAVALFNLPLGYAFPGPFFGADAGCKS
jgi:hypothetical protein